jgi:hypothetical protein
VSAYIPICHKPGRSPVSYSDGSLVLRLGSSRRQRSIQLLDKRMYSPLSYCLIAIVGYCHFISRFCLRLERDICLQSSLASARQVPQCSNPDAGAAPRPLFALAPVAESSGRHRDRDCLVVLGFATRHSCAPRNSAHGFRVPRTCRLTGPHATADGVASNGNSRCRLIQGLTASSARGRDERMERTGQ